MMKRVRAARICVHLCASASKFSLVRGANSSGEVVGEAFQENDLMGRVFTDGVGAESVFERGRVGAGKNLARRWEPMNTDKARSADKVGGEVLDDADGFNA